MNRDSETLGDRLLSWLLWEDLPQSQSFERSRPMVTGGAQDDVFLSSSQPHTWIDGTDNVESQNPGNLDQEVFVNPLAQASDLNSQNPDLWDSDTSSAYLSRSSGLESFELGEGSVVQDRFYALLKRRLHVEIQNSPPLFPWENEILDYADAEVWAPQFQALSLPVALPEALVTTLFERCQQLIQTVHQQGLQLVEAVEQLFPDDRDKLNDFAGMVLLGASRDEERSRNWLLGSDPPVSYEQALPSQRIVLALMVAQDFLAQSTLELSPQDPKVLRHWQTSRGELNVTASCLQNLSQHSLETSPSELIKLDVGAVLPTAGEISLRVGETITTVKRDTHGPVNLVVPAAQMGTSYPLDIHLESADQPLKFVIRFEKDSLEE